MQLSQLQPVLVQQGWGALGIDKSAEGKPLTVDGQRYERGLGTHAQGLLVYSVPAGAKRFVAVVGLDDEKLDDPRSSVTFEVYGDVKEMGESPQLLAKSPRLCQKTLRRWAFDIELNDRFRELRLGCDGCRRRYCRRPCGPGGCRVCAEVTGSTCADWLRCCVSGLHALTSQQFASNAQPPRVAVNGQFLIDCSLPRVKLTVILCRLSGVGAEDWQHLSMPALLLLSSPMGG